VQASDERLVEPLRLLLLPRCPLLRKELAGLVLDASPVTARVSNNRCFLFIAGLGIVEFVPGELDGASWVGTRQGSRAANPQPGTRGEKLAQRTVHCEPTQIEENGSERESQNTKTTASERARVTLNRRESHV